ncbi:hypothetical protein HUJ05_001077 [Dendroctonus ponderosae]|nr:hypothetical protein HUJ05_001077 [Dendroctonus ponderosae]
MTCLKHQLSKIAAVSFKDICLTISHTVKIILDIVLKYPCTICLEDTLPCFLNDSEACLLVVGSQELSMRQKQGAPSTMIILFPAAPGETSLRFFLLFRLSLGIIISLLSPMPTSESPEFKLCLVNRGPVMRIVKQNRATKKLELDERKPEMRMDVPLSSYRAKLDNGNEISCRSTDYSK